MSSNNQFHLPHVGRTYKLILLAIAISACLFTFDVMMPLGVAGGIPYVALIMLGLWFPERKDVIYLALLGTALTFLGYSMAPIGGMVLVNRVLALAAIWITALLIYKYSQLMADQRKMVRAVEQSTIGILITDPNGVIEYVNPKLLDMTGYEKFDVVGSNSRIFKSGLTPVETYENLWTTIKAGKEWRGELINKHKNGQLFWENAQIFPVKGRAGAIRNFVAIKEDITERKRKEEELILAKLDAENANEAKTAFLANISHEFRTPMNAILGFTELMQMKIFGSLQNEKYEEYVENIHYSAAHLRELIDKILDLSKIEAGKQELNETEIDISDLFNSCMSMGVELAKEAGVNAENVCQDNLPNLLADETMIRQVLVNLLSNAIKFTPKGGNITLNAALDRKDRLILAVTDNGIGIAKSDFEKALSAFGQVENVFTRSHTGSGLGLAICEQLVQLHGGKLELDSVLGEGTTVRLIFPATRTVESKSG